MIKFDLFFKWIIISLWPCLDIFFYLILKKTIFIFPSPPTERKILQKIQCWVGNSDHARHYWPTDLVYLILLCRDLFPEHRIQFSSEKNWAGWLTDWLWCFNFVKVLTTNICSSSTVKTNLTFVQLHYKAFQ